MTESGMLAVHRGLRRAGAPFDVPVDPDADEAARWLRDELARPPYQEAQPTWFDRLARSLWEWLSSLSPEPIDGPPGLGQLLVVLVAVAVIVGAFIVFGRPALSRRSRAAESLFGDDDTRDAAAMRRDAERAAASGAWPDAIADMFRAVARGLAERAVVTTTPGTTAQHFASTAAVAFPRHSDDLTASAVIFDGVRYLGRPGDAAEYRRVSALESSLRSARPELPEQPAAAEHAG